MNTLESVLMGWAVLATAAALFFAYRSKVASAIADVKADIAKLAGDVRAKL